MIFEEEVKERQVFMISVCSMIGKEKKKSEVDKGACLMYAPDDDDDNSNVYVKT